MFDVYSRPITYLRFSVTDRCNLRCRYCMPEEGVALRTHDDILRHEEIETIVARGVARGIRKVRLTGGEPLVRRGIVSLVEKIAAIKGVEDFGMTTNGVFLSKYAAALKSAGLHRLNVSLDSLDAQEYARITRTGSLADVLEGIDAALDAGFVGTKINCVIDHSPDESNARSVRRFGEARGLDVRFIRRMNTGQGEFWQVIGGEGGKCETCNRLRVSSNGFVYPCLFSDVSFSIRQLGIDEAFSRALKHKPESGCRSNNQFFRIGG